LDKCVFLSSNFYNLKDTPKHQGLRNRLLEVIIQKGIKSKEVLRAMSKVPRHLFMDSALESHAYEDKAFPIAAEQTISQPFTVAYQTELLEVKPNAKILEIGTGSGYQTAVLIEMGAKVYTVERQNELFKKTKLFLPKLGYKPKYMSFGDGYKGLEEYAPFDGIIVTAGAPYVPKALLSQLKIGGRLVIPVGEKSQTMYVYTRTGETKFSKKAFGAFRFVPLLKEKK
jgi:protein-L-isoaspartate(D-aspartate) O-methyltransferase